MQRLTLILPIADQEMGNLMSSIVGSNPANLTTFNDSLLTAIGFPLDVTHCWTSVIISDAERTSLGMSLTLFPDAIFVFHECDDDMTVTLSNHPDIAPLVGQPLSPTDALTVLDLAPFSAGVTP